jgi:hypothetical protein
VASEGVRRGGIYRIPASSLRRRGAVHGWRLKGYEAEGYHGQWGVGGRLKGSRAAALGAIARGRFERTGVSKKRSRGRMTCERTSG